MLYHICIMTETIPATYLNRPAIGYIYVALLSENTQTEIGSLLNQLSKELPGVIWPMPAQAMHTTLCEIIQSRKTYSEDKDALYASHRQEYEVGAAEVFRPIPSFSVLLNHIEVSPEAIIIRAEKGNAFNYIREKLLGHITLPAETKRPPDVIHASIARYLCPVDVEDVRAAVAKHTIALAEPITEFKLLKTLIPPLLKYEEIASFPLTSSE